MKRPYSLIAALLLTFCAVSSFAQEQDKPMPDRWHGLIIDQSTPEEVVRSLGKPTKEGRAAFKAYPLGKRLNAGKEPVQYFEYKKLPDIDNALFAFKDSKLILITLSLQKKIAAAAVPNIYGLTFEPKFGNIDMALDSGNYERNQGKAYPVNYPAVYYLLASTDKTLLSVQVQNTSMKSLLGGSSRGSSGDGAFPGDVKVIQIFSRTLENREGASVLK